MIANITSDVASCTVLDFVYWNCVLYSSSFAQGLFYKLILVRVLDKQTETIH